MGIKYDGTSVARVDKGEHVFAEDSADTKVERIVLSTQVLTKIAS